MSRVLFILITIAVLTSAVKESIKSIDLDELSPKENNCRVSETSSSTIKCSKIPLFCRSVCEQAKRLSFDANLKRISPFSFGAYKIKQSLEVNFGSSLKHIDTDAFNGMIVEEDAVLYINIGDTDDDSLVPTNKEGEKIENVEKTEDVRKEEEDEKQIEYDIETPSTKPDIQVNQANDRMSLKSLNVASNAFRGLLIKEGARVLITIRKYDKIEFGAQSVVNMKQMSNSVLSFAISDTGLVLFREKCADSWKPYVDDYLDPSGNNDYDGKSNIDYSSDQSPIEHVLFKFSLVGVSKVLFEREAFSNMRLFNSSTFQIQVINFEVAMLGKSSFSNMVQQKKSNFELTLANGKETELSEGLFSDLVQGESSKFIIYFRLDKNSKSDRKDQLCLGEGTFGHLSQAENSTVRLTFLTQNIRLSFGSKSLNEVRQSLGSIIQVYVSGAKEVRFEAESLVNVSQALESSLEIWVSRSGNFEVAARAFRGINQGERSTVRLGYTDGQSLFDQGNHFVSAYVQSPFAFDKWNSTETSMLVYEFTKGANFKLKFPPRPIPRMLITSNNETVEEAAMRLFPSLGRLSRPDTISLNEYELRGRDFCRIVDIPFDVLVRVSPKTECSCALLYLYRVVRRVRPELLAVSGVAPACYRERLSSPGFLETEERACDFDSKVRECHQRSENDVQNNGWECRASSFEYYDERTLTVNTTPSTPVVDTVNDDLNNEDDLIDDSSAEKSTEIYDDWLSSDAIITSNDVVASGVQEAKEEPASNNQIDLGESTMDDDEDEDDEDDDDDDESEEDEDDPNRLNEEMNSEDGNDILLGVDNTEKRRSKPLSISRFESLRRFLVHSTLFELGVIAATALTLIVIVLVVLAILMRRVRCCSSCRSCCVKKHGFTEYYDDEDDEDDDEFIEKPSKYSLYENANSNDYAVVVKCDETSKTKSALAHCLRDDVSHCSSTTELINVKSNPLGNV